MQKTYKHIIWDWNGTLMDDTELCIDIINTILEERSLPLVSLEKYKTQFQFPVEKYYQSLGFDIDRDSFNAVSKLFVTAYNEKRFQCPLHDTALQTLKLIQQRGIHQSILSAYLQTTLEEIIAHYNLTSFFKNLAGLDNIYAAGKIELGKSLLNKISEPTSEILLIGDTVHDYEVAQALAVDCILLDHGHNDTERLKQCKVPVYTSLDKILMHLNETAA